MPKADKIDLMKKYNISLKTIIVFIIIGFLSLITLLSFDDCRNRIGINKFYNFKYYFPLLKN